MKIMRASDWTILIGKKVVDLEFDNQSRLSKIFLEGAQVVTPAHSYDGDSLSVTTLEDPEREKA